MLVVTTSNFQGATIRPIVPRHKHSIVVAACLKTENDKNLFIEISIPYRALRCFVFSVVCLISSSDDIITSIHV